MKLGLVMDGSGRGRRRIGDMVKNELAEGKTIFGGGDDIDPDAFSYIDEKIQHVLGHFQKEFEGGVSAESLGAKFGGYGSFLPAHQRSPSILSQPKSLVKVPNHNVSRSPCNISPVKMPNHNVSRSPCNLQPEDGNQYPSVLGTTPITKVNIASGGQLSEKSGKRKTNISTERTEAISQSPSKPVNISNQKMLKVHIKVGHANVLPRNKPDIYSDLGLDVSPSPSPSLGDSPNGDDPESPDAFLESPNTILQIMTCFSVPGGYILSPLPDSLQPSNEKEDIFLKDFKTGGLFKGQTEACAASSDTSLSFKFVNGSACKKIKSGDKSQMLKEAEGLTCKGDMTFFKKETEAEAPVDQTVNAPDMSHSSRARCGDAREERQLNGSSEKEICNTAGNFKDTDKVSLKEDIPISNLRTDNLVGFVEGIRNDFTGNSVKKDIHSNGEMNSKSGLTVKSFEERIGNNQDTSCEPAERGSQDLKSYNTTKADSRRYNNGWKNRTTEHEGPANHDPSQKTSSCEKELLMTIQEIDKANGGRIPKGSPTYDRQCAEPSKENLRTSSSVVPKGKNEISHESKLKAHKLHMKVKKGKAVESHKGSSRFIEKSKVKLGLCKADNLQIANSATDALAVAPLSYNAPPSDAPAAISTSVIKDNWVICDFCQTWRLLPYETNPDNLPQKWQCSMQVWLPGLNKCYISEDETTKAFHQLYQVFAPVNGTDLTAQPDAAVPETTSGGILNHNGRLENKACSVPSGIKKKHGLMDASNLSSSGKSLQACSENRSLNDVRRYSLETDSSIKHRIGQTNRSAELTIEKHNYKVEEKPSKIPASCPNEGDLLGKVGKNSRSKCRRQVDLDGHRSCKKIKRDSLHYSEKHFHNEDEIVGKMTISGDCDFPPRASRKVLQSSSDHSSMDFKSKAEPSKNPKQSVGAFPNGEHKEHVSTSDTEKLNRYDSKDKKRGVKELQGSGTHRKNSMIHQQLVENRCIIKDGSSESELRRQKKPKLAKSEGQDSSAVIVDRKMDKKGCLTRIKFSSGKKNQPDKVDEGRIHALEFMDAMKRDVTNVRLAIAATSSSSKASGSQRSKVNLQEARESPVESVSSSPMRMPNTQNNFTKVSVSTKHDILSTAPSVKDNLENDSKQHKVHDLRVSATGGSCTKSISQESLLQASSNQKLDHSSQIIVDGSERSSGKVIQTSHTAKAKQNGWGSQTVPTSMKERNSKQYHVGAVNGEATKSAKKLRTSDSLNEVHSNNFPQPPLALPESSLMKKDAHNTVNAFIQEARDLKHTASRLKNDGLEHESSGIFFEASLKFLHVASLMEPPNAEFVRQGDLFPSVKMLNMYVETAKLCEFCAHEYENLKEMAAAALAYKCAEVAYMKVAYFKHPSASKDRHELQSALDAALSGESPSPSASHVDILNNQGNFEKVVSARTTGSPQLAANFVIAAQNRPHLQRLLTYTNYLNSAFEAANKSRNAIAAASIDLAKDRVGSVCSVREVLDFNFNNVEGLLQLVRGSLKSISR
ncbi:hypothetical protein M5K25_010602 [Dendrobium thyrsiflorum]|uniref:CW-type domain-containing protein n=1 Tax=Dendrobium thyrsiflorum TaxID=117978 RepID=A0ABD0V117_DENTH